MIGGALRKRRSKRVDYKLASTAHFARAKFIAGNSSPFIGIKPP